MSKILTVLCGDSLVPVPGTVVRVTYLIPSTSTVRTYLVRVEGRFGEDVLVQKSRDVLNHSLKT